MALSETEVKAILKTPVNRATIAVAAAHEARLKMHSETTLNRNTNFAVTNFLKMVRAWISAEDKYRVFCSLFQFPVKTVAFLNDVFAAFDPIFNAQNPVYSCEFSNARYNEDWENYRVEELKSNDIWRTKGMKCLKSRINSVIIVDLPAEQATESPTPYFYFLDIENVIDYDFVGDTDILDWIIFRQPNDEIAVFDDESFRIYKTEKDEYLTIDSLKADAPHDLKYCPAAFFEREAISDEKKGVKKSILTDHLSDLDWYLFYAISKRHADLTAPWPPQWGYERDCNYTNNTTKEKCDNGFLRDSNKQYILLSSGELRGCPVCSRKRLSGPGSFIEVPFPDSETPSAVPPAGVINADIPAVKQIRIEVETLAKEIFTKITGSPIDSVDNQAINKDQVMSIIESRKNRLKKVKQTFEVAQQWTDTTLCKLRYGSSFISCAISYGTEFHMFTADLLRLIYAEAKKSEADDLTLDYLQDQYFESLYFNNPQNLNRQNLLLNVDPFRHLSKEQVRVMFEKNIISFDDYILKMNFSSLIMKFERENGSILNFGVNLDLSKRVSTIIEIMKKYSVQPEVKTPEPVVGL